MTVPARNENEGDLPEVADPFRYQDLPVVGIGGSAGALPALQQFFSAMPASTGLAFVVVMHLSPEHDSALAEILQATTALRVVRVENTVGIEPDCVYVIPPKKMLRAMDGHISLVELPDRRRQHVAVDLFFRTLADTHGPHAVAVVLSGADGDGAIGIKRIKERGGLTIVQDPIEARHDSMPRSALATGMVDWILPVAKMPERILSYERREPALRLPPENVDRPGGSDERSDTDEAALKDVLALLRARTGRNFNYYKRATILRRVGRRMLVNDVDDLPGYLEVLRTRAGESGALLQDLLISVTNFFRDGECFAALEAQIPALFEGKRSSDVIRVWVVACATGEEAYSVAMLLQEYAKTLDAPPAIQVFATDLDEDAIGAARDGFYPDTIQADVNEDRLRRFFVKETGGYRVRRELRETILFAVHDALKDSPFSRLDLITCRNLMIYLTRAAQTRLLDTFHFAMLADATLFLGSSESVEESNHQYAVVDKKHRVYAKRAMVRSGLPQLEGPSSLALSAHVAWPSRGTPVTTGFAFAQPAQIGAPAVSLDGRASSWGEMHFKLLEHLAPPSVLVDGNYDLLHLSRSAGQFLQYGGGEPSRNLLRSIHPSLRLELRAALFQAAQAHHAVEVAPLALDLGGSNCFVSMRVAPAQELAPGLLVVSFDVSQTAEAVDDAAGDPVVLSSKVAATHLDRELERLKLHLRETVEQYEASNEELKASNEELQAMNEELRSATEELETSREELQSINEELTTVNQELKSNVDQLSHANSDMQNLMDATDIATIFLDRDLCITRYTPSAIELFSLIPTDVGRPLSDLRTMVEYANLTVDARSVLERLIPIEREAGGPGGRWFVIRLRPYRTLEDRIAGVVITFVDNTERRLTQDRLRDSEARYSAIVTEATVGVVQTELTGDILFANRCFLKLLGHSEADVLGRSILEFVHPADVEESRARLTQLACDKQSFQLEKRCVCKGGQLIWMHNSASVLADQQGSPTSLLLVCSDITARKSAEDRLRASEERLRLVIESAVGYAIFSTDLDRRVVSWNAGAERLLGYSEQDVLGHRCDVIYTRSDLMANVPSQEAALALKGELKYEEREKVRKDGSTFWASGVMTTMHDASGKIVGFVKVLRDQTEERAATAQLELSKSKLVDALAGKDAALRALKQADASKDQFLAVLSHELRNPLAAIHSAGEMLLKQEVGEEHPSSRMARVVERQSRSMRLLLDDLLDVSRLRLQKLKLQPSVSSVRAIVEGAVEAVRPAIDDAKHQLDVRLPDEEIVVFADEVRMIQVISNLMSNAAKYTPPGGKIVVSASHFQTCVQFKISDNGIGMESHTVDAMFEMFKQAPAGTLPLNGMGIGLALSRSIVELHNGTIEGESAGPGKGSTFTVRIPLPEPDSIWPENESVPEGSLNPSTQSALPTLNALRILIVDDNEDVAWLTSEMLMEQGHAVEVANDGESALVIAPSFRPDAILLDIGMPGMDGYEVARRIRSEPWGRTIFLVAATGWGQDDDRTRSKDAGFDHHLTKPIRAADLLDLLSHAGGPTET